MRSSPKERKKRKKKRASEREEGRVGERNAAEGRRGTEEEKDNQRTYSRHWEDKRRQST